MFGLQNATITEYYANAAMTTDIYGSKTRGAPTTMSKRCWIEEAKSDQRLVVRDQYSKTASAYLDQVATINEDDLLKIVPDTATGIQTTIWKIQRKVSSSTSVGIFRMVLELIEEK